MASHSQWIRQNLLGLVAIFIALSGTAVAVQGERDAVTSKKKAKAKRGPRGPAGPQGTQGPQGSQGLQGPVGPSTGPAGGTLAGSYPNPSLAAGSVGTEEIANDIPAVHVFRVADQAVPNLTSLELNFTSESYDTANMHSTSVNDERLTAPVAGIYEVTGQSDFNDSTDCSISIVEGGTTPGYIAMAIGCDYQTVTTQTELAAGDYVTLEAFQASGGPGSPVVHAVGELSPRFSMHWVAPG